VDEQECRIWK